MMDQSIVSKPTILLYATEHISEDILKPVLYGIEEEGLPVVIESHSGTHMTLADLASRNSALSVGIGVDDEAIVGGLARFNGQSVVAIGHQKGRDTKAKIKRNFGMPRPEGYRKALRLMHMAEKFTGS